MATAYVLAHERSTQREAAASNDADPALGGTAQLKVENDLEVRQFGDEVPAQRTHALQVPVVQAAAMKATTR
jgi:hypothetical protein